MITAGAQSIYSVTDGARTLSVPLQWGFGAGAQTWLFSMNGKFYESLVSYFPEVNGLAMTLGDDVFAPHNLVEALGRELGQQDVKSCFGCHTTGALVDGQLDLASFRPGVTCEIATRAPARIWPTPCRPNSVPLRRTWVPCLPKACRISAGSATLVSTS